MEYLEVLSNEIRYRKECVRDDIYRLYLKKNDIELLENYLDELKAIKEANPSEALKCSLKLYKMVESAGNGNGFSLNKAWEYHNTIKQALLKAQKEHNALEIFKKHFNIEFSTESERNGNVWGRLVSIQSKEDEGTYDTTATANLVDFKEDYDLWEEVLKE